MHHARYTTTKKTQNNRTSGRSRTEDQCIDALLASKEAGTKEASASAADTDSVPPRLFLDQESPAALEVTLIDETVSRGLLDWDIARTAFDHYRTNMSHYFPFVVFATKSDADALKEQHPLLYFAIVTIGLSRMKTKVDSELYDMLFKDLALRIVYKGERSLELVQRLLIHVCFYSRALQMGDLNFNQMII